MGKRGRPPKQKEPEVTPEVVEQALPPDGRKAINPAFGPIREGGKSALVTENKELVLKEEASRETTERDRIGDQYMEQTYGAPNEELPQENQEALPTSGEEVPEEQTEEAAPEEEPQELQQEEEMVPTSQLKDTQDKMHQATGEAANYRKLMDEMAPFVDWEKYQLSLKGEGRPSTPAQPSVELPSQDLFVSDYQKWADQFEKYYEQKMWNKFESEALPQVTNQASVQTEWARLEEEFTKDIEAAPGGSKRWIHLMNTYINDVRQPNDTRTPREIFQAARENFKKDFGHVLSAKKTGKKVVPLESPARAKEKHAAGPEREITMQDWDKESRDYVAFRQKRLRDLQSR